jgi:hypothetical protein
LERGIKENTLRGVIVYDEERLGSPIWTLPEEEGEETLSF